MSIGYDLQRAPERASGPGPSCDWILGTLERRRQDRSSMMENMRRVRDIYNSDVVLPLPELDTTEAPTVADLITTGIDQTAQRIASVMPVVDCPPLRVGIQASEDKARRRTMAIASWWQANRLPAKMRRRARWLIAYGMAPAVIRPDYKRGMPSWEIRDPLSAYPAPTQDPDDICPPDAIFTYFKSWGWLRSVYPVAAARLLSQWAAQFGADHRPPGNMQIELVEYVDAEATVLGVLGPKQMGSQWGESMGLQTATAFVELERVRNRSGICPVVVPGRITLDRPKGQFDSAVGMYSMQARFMALELIAVERGIFPDTYLISRQGEQAQFISGPHDGRTGLVNIVQGGDIREQNLNPGFATTNIMDRLERNMRVSTATPAEYGGESQTNVRTGRRGDSIIAAATSFPIQEAQEVFADALAEENRRAIAVAKSCFDDAPRSFHVTWRGRSQVADYLPSRDFETDVNTVTYSMAGADANSLVVGLGQRVGLGLLSKKTAQTLDPLVSDPDAENDRVTAEALTAAVLASLQAQAQQGAIPPADIGRIAELVATNAKDLFGAIAQVQREAQERQANAGPPGTPTGPVAPGSPEAMPGLAMPGQGQEVPTVGAPPAGLENLSGFLQMLRG